MVEVMKQKLIMENWRRFLKEQKERGVRLPEEQVCMRVEITPGSDAVLTMYTPGQSDDVVEQFHDLTIIGEVSLSSLDSSGPCLKGKGKQPSWQIEAIHTAQEFRNVGYGGLLYGFAFLIAKQNNAGLTSDKDAGSKDDAKEKWSSFESNPGTFDKVETEDGNNTFDYDGDKTPEDPNDDCDVSVEPKDNATDFSLDHKNPSIYERPLMDYEANHMDFLDALLSSGKVSESEFTESLDTKAFASFQRAYDEA
jgi:hypothetical protein